MSRKPLKKLLVAGLAALSAAVLLAGCSTTTASPQTELAAATASGSGTPTAHHGGLAHLTAYSDNDGPTDTVIVTGTIGDYGKAVSVYPDGTIDPEHDSELSLQLSHGTFRLDVAALDKAFTQAFIHDFPTSTATCSGSFAITQKVPVIAGSGTGAYKGVGGSFTLTITLDEVDKTSAAQPCNGTAPFLSQAIVISGPGTITF
jgi:hypothetical protein